MAQLETGIDHEDELVVVGKTREADGLVSLTLQREDRGRLPDWTPGAHIDLILPSGETRQYSLSGDPFDWRTYRLCVLREEHGGGGSRYVHDELQVGDAVRFGGPRNNFELVPSAHHSFLAGGVGITAILPMLRAAEQLGSTWRLLYLGRSRPSMAFLTELEERGGAVVVHPADELARADVAGWIAAAPEDDRLYVCGPERLLDAVEAATADRATGTVRMERFTARAQSAPARLTPFDVELRESGLVVTVQPDETVTTAIRSVGVQILTSCARGVCGTCETAVLQGEPDHRDSLLDDGERRANDCMFPCVSRSLTDRLVLDL